MSLLGADIEYSEGEILVQVDPLSDIADIRQLLVEQGLSVTGGLLQLDLLRAEVRSGMSSWSALQGARAIAGVVDAGLNGILRSCGSAEPPDDTYFGDQWHLHNDGQNGGTRGADINALTAWSIEKGRHEIVVAVVDTGIRTDHPEFEGKLVPGYDFVDEDDNPHSLVIHGSYMAAAISATVGNAYGYAGVAPGCRIMPIRAASATGATAFDLVQGIVFAADQGASVINVSFGGPTAAAFGMETALAYARERGSIVVTAAGDSGVSADDLMPASSPHAICIVATDKNDKRNQLANWGWSIDFAAPGVALPLLYPVPGLDEPATKVTGSSAASAVTSGIVALLKSHEPTLTFEDAYKYLRLGAEDQVNTPIYDPPGFDIAYGHGRLNAAASLKAICHCTEDDEFWGFPEWVDAKDTHRLVVDVGPGHAGDEYIVLGSASGTMPGQTILGMLLPLNNDRYFQATLHLASPWLRGPRGRLDENGRARASLTMPGYIPPSMVGVTLHHAAVLLRDGGPVHITPPTPCQVRGIFSVDAIDSHSKSKP